MNISELKTSDISKFNLDVIAVVDLDPTTFGSYIISRDEILDEASSDKEEINAVFMRIIMQQLSERWHLSKDDFFIKINGIKQIYHMGDNKAVKAAITPLDFFDSSMS